MPETPMQAILRALDALDLDRAMALFAPDATLTTAFGERAVGRDAVRGVLGAFLRELRVAHHELTSEWNPEPGVWVAEMSASYELSDYSQRGPYDRAIILRADGAGIERMEIYGAHELPLSEVGRPYSEVRGAHGWLPTL